MSPLEVIDGAIISADCLTSSHKHTTYHHQNNPVVIEALERHLKDMNFVGVVVTVGPSSLDGKERSSAIAANLAGLLKCDGVIITEECAGNPDTDLMMNCRKAEQIGVKTVLITDELAGQDGLSQGLADTTPEANAVVSTGNANEFVTLPPMKKIIGDVSVIGRAGGTYGDSLLPDGSLKVEAIGIVGSCNEMGYGCLTCKTV